MVYTNSVNEFGFPSSDATLGEGDDSFARYFYGNISEVMFFNRALTQPERDVVATNYLNKRYNLW
jgi:hypothetical protein